jgi:hypothetical protein
MIYCTDHVHQGCRAGFQAVSRLEQYAFLLNVYLRRLHHVLKKRKVIPLTPGMCFFFFPSRRMTLSLAVETMA